MKFLDHNRATTIIAVIKKFHDKDIYEKEKKIYEKLKGKFLTPELISITDDSIIMERELTIQEFLEGSDPLITTGQKKLFVKNILKQLKRLYDEGISHNDFHVGNLVVRTKDYMPLFIDFEKATEIDNTKVPFLETNDVTGQTYMGFDADKRESVKTMFGYKAEELWKEILTDELEKISFGHYTGKPYGSYHHPKFTYTNTQRDTLERYNRYKIKLSDLRSKRILDLGCNTGAMLLMAKQFEAAKVMGIDNHEPNILFNRNLFNFCGYPDAEFQYRNVDDIKEDFIGYDIIFCFALNAWCNEELLIKKLSESGAETIYWESNKGDKTIPNYKCEFVGTDGGRFCYVCRK